MDDEDRKLIYRVIKLEEENNAMLRSLVSAMRWGRAFKIFYWVLIIGLSFGAYYLIQPYLNTLTNGLENSVEVLHNAGDIIKNVKQ